MRLSVRGQPLHTRHMTLDLFQGEGGKLRAWGEILDLRKASFVPMVDQLQTAGIIHHMSIDAQVDAASRVLEVLETEQPNVAVEAAPLGGGECCRDPAPALQALVGLPFDADFPKQLGRVFGGPRGCSHLLTLFYQMAGSLPRALDYEGAARAEQPADREPGERIFRRAIYLDGFEPDAESVHLAISLMDYHSAPLALGDRRLDLLGEQHEVRVLVEVSLTSLQFVDLHAGERTRTREDMSSTWVDRTDWIRSLVGRGVMPGLGTELRGMLGDEPGAARVLDAMLQIAPGFVQCMPAMADRAYEGLSTGSRPSDGHGMPRFLATGGGADSCYVWRTGGPLLKIWGMPDAGDG